MLIVVVNGHPESGKDTFVRFCWNELTVTNLIKVYEYDSVGKYKEIFKRYLGWDGIDKDLKWRKAMSEMKQLDIEYRDGPRCDFIEFLSRIDHNSVVFTYIREPKEIDALKESPPVGIDVKTVVVVRYKGDDPDFAFQANGCDYGNDSDNMVRNYDYDHIIFNSDKDPSKMRNMAKAFIRSIKLSHFKVS